jgi:magnesium transporter
MTGKGVPTVLAEDRLDATLAAAAPWLDLLCPTEVERAFAERATGLRLPTEGDIAEIENSSRLAFEDGILTLSTPMVSRDARDRLSTRPIGFVLSCDRLITLRYAGSNIFDHVSDHWRLPEGQAGGTQAFLTLMEAIVDRLADVLEHMGSELDAVSARVFRNEGVPAQSSRRRDAFLRATLADIGRRGELISQLRDGLLGAGRIARFTHENAVAWLTDPESRRLVVLERDIASLADYDSQLTGKTQFLLDATLGFISIEQNNSIKVLTVVSIVGIPPTLIASIYGMNFKGMPELDWHYGYEYGLSLIALSIIIPLAIFWRKGWL